KRELSLGLRLATRGGDQPRRKSKTGVGGIEQRAECAVIDVECVAASSVDAHDDRLGFGHECPSRLAQKLARVLDGQLVGTAHNLLNEARKLWWIGVWVAAREAAANIDGIDKDARFHDELAELPQRLAERGGDHGLGADMEGDAEPARNLPGVQKKRRRLGARHAELALVRDEALRIGTSDAQVEVQ